MDLRLRVLRVRFRCADSVAEYLVAGTFWMLLWLAFEWIGSGITRRPLRAILEGWQVERGYMWPYVLLAYLLSPVIVGLTLSPGD